MSKIDYQALREIAAAAVGAHERLSVMPPDDIFDISLAEGTQLDADITALNALNSAASPATVLALLDELEAAEKQIAESESLMVPQLPQPAVTHDAATAIRACLDEFPEGVRDIVEECAAIAENACCADKPAPVSVPAAMEIDDDFDSAFEHGKAVGWNAYRAAMLQGAEPVTTAYKSPDDFICMLTGRAKYLREKGEIKSPELLERAAAALQGESVNAPSIPNGWKLVPIDPTKDMLRAGQSVVGFWLNTVHCYSKMLAAAPAAPQQEVK